MGKREMEGRCAASGAHRATGKGTPNSVASPHRDPTPRVPFTFPITHYLLPLFISPPFPIPFVSPALPPAALRET